MKKIVFAAVLPIFLVTMAWSGAAMACDKKCQRKVDRALKSYAKYVEKAEQKSCDTQSGKKASLIQRQCEKALESLDKRYDGFAEDQYADEILNHPEIKALRERHLQLKQRLGGLADIDRIEKITEPMARKLRSLESNTCSLESSYMFEPCREGLMYAQQYYEKIPEADRSLPQVKELKERFDKLVEIQKQMVAKEGNKETKFMADIALKDEFKQQNLNLLLLGKENMATDRLDLIDDLGKDLEEVMSRAKQFAKDCRGKYADIAEKEWAATKCEVAQNAEKYRRQVIIASYKAYLDKQVEQVAKEINFLKNNRSIETSIFNFYMNRYDKYTNRVTKKYEQGYKLAGEQAPADNRLKSLKDEFASVLKEVLKANGKWDDSKLHKPSGLIRKKTEEAAKEMDCEVVDIGMNSDAWTVIKTHLGIPLRKYNDGYVLLKAPKESFYRKHHFEVIRAFDGVEYADFSEMKISEIVTPVEK